MDSSLCRWMLVLISVFLLLLCGHVRYASAIEAASLRGVAPSILSRYQNPSRFTCLSERIEIDITRVNDDVCDCADGSDEPGTSACANGIFHCQNQGFKSLDLPATFVDDGICDCCDGSDETQGCNDSCQELGQLARLDAQTKLDRYLAGANARSALENEASRKVQTWKGRSKQLEDTVGQLKPVVDLLHGLFPSPSQLLVLVSLRITELVTAQHTCRVLRLQSKGSAYRAEEMEEAQKQQREAEEADKESANSKQDHLTNPSSEEDDELAHDDENSDVYDHVQVLTRMPLSASACVR